MLNIITIGLPYRGVPLGIYKILSSQTKVLKILQGLTTNNDETILTTKSSTTDQFIDLDDNEQGSIERNS